MLEVPVRVLVTESVAVMVCEPTVPNETLKLPAPPVRVPLVELKAAAVSELEKAAVPA